MTPRNLPEAVVTAVASPYPASFDGSTLRFTLALTSLLCISVVGGMLCQWMLREIWHGRRDAFPTEPLFAIRLVIALAALTAVLRSAPEAAMMITWRESVEAAATILVAKRWFDSIALLPAMAWMGVSFVFYPKICMALVRLAQEDGRGFVPKMPREKLKQLAVTIIVIFAISTLIAVGKRW